MMQILLDFALLNFEYEQPLLFHIIDDLTVLVSEWTAKPLLGLLKIMRTILKANSLPIKVSNSCPLPTVIESLVTFLGCPSNLISREIQPNLNKLLKVCH